VIAKSCIPDFVHGSIPHREGKIKYLRSGFAARSEGSKGEPFPNPAHFFEKSTANTTSCGQILPDPLPGDTEIRNSEQSRQGVISAQKRKNHGFVQGAGLFWILSIE
jgi:hypothetical protein